MLAYTSRSLTRFASLAAPFQMRSTSTVQVCPLISVTFPVKTNCARPKPSSGEIFSHEHAWAVPAHTIVEKTSAIANLVADGMIMAADPTGSIRARRGRHWHRGLG